MNVLGVKSRSW